MWQLIFFLEGTYIYFNYITKTFLLKTPNSILICTALTNQPLNQNLPTDYCISHQQLQNNQIYFIVTPPKYLPTFFYNFYKIAKYQFSMQFYLSYNHNSFANYKTLSNPCKYKNNNALNNYKL